VARRPYSGSWPPLTWLRDTLIGHTTLGRTTLDEWSARKRDLCLTTHTTHTPASERPQTYARLSGHWDRLGLFSGFTILPLHSARLIPHCSYNQNRPVPLLLAVLKYVISSTDISVSHLICHYTFVYLSVILWFRRLIAGLSAIRSEFDQRSVLVEFVVVTMIFHFHLQSTPCSLKTDSVFR
jgi:hypothetical protein